MTTTYSAHFQLTTRPEVTYTQTASDLAQLAAIIMGALETGTAICTRITEDESR